MREVVAFCADRCVDVVPELEMPGHTSALLAAFPLTGTLKTALSLPFLRPGAGVTALLFVGALVLSVLAALLTAAASARKITGDETGLLLREDT